MPRSYLIDNDVIIIFLIMLTLHYSEREGRKQNTTGVGGFCRPALRELGFQTFMALRRTPVVPSLRKRAEF